MANQDPSKNQVMKRKWFYDHLSDLMRLQLEDYREMEADLSSKRAELDKKVPSIEEIIKRVDPKETFLELSKREADENLRVLDDRIGSVRHNLDFLKKQHLFIMGPATTESLMNQKPTNYDYIRSFKLPFHDNFFEFLEPITMKLPFYKVDKNLHGIALNVVEGAEAPEYFMKMYFSNSPRDLALLAFSMDVENPDTITGKIASFKGKCFDSSGIENEGVFLFNADLSTNKVTYCTHNDDRDAKIKLKLNHENYMNRFRAETKNQEGDLLEETLFKREAVFSDFGAPESIFQTANLCVNLINYINAHNVTVITKERQVDYLERNANGKRKKRTKISPYHLIILKDRVIERSERPEGDYEKAWELQERIFVRGHDRKYKHEDDTIRLVSWIPPHIKGPENAPFAEQRYQVLYEKLDREVRMFRELGLKHDSEMWMERK